MAEGVDVLDGSRNRLSVSLVHSDKQLTRATECIINGLCVCVCLSLEIILIFHVPDRKQHLGFENIYNIFSAKW